jgi:hypothetical protein
MTRKTRKIKRSRSRRKSRQVKRSRRKTRQVKRSRRKTRRVKRSRRKIKGGAFPVIGLGALALLGAGSVAAKKLMNRPKSPESLTNDDIQPYSMSSYGTGLQTRYEPSATDVAIANSKMRWAEEDSEYERTAAEERRTAAEEKRTVIATNNQKKLEKSNRKQAAEEERRTAVEKERREANRLRRHEIYVAAERKRKQDHYDKEEIRIQALISKDLAKDASRVAASKVKRIPVRPTVFKKVTDMNTQEMQDAAYFRAEDQRIKNEIAARPENALSMNPFY